MKWLVVWCVGFACGGGALVLAQAAYRAVERRLQQRLVRMQLAAELRKASASQLVDELSNRSVDEIEREAAQ